MDRIQGSRPYLQVDDITSANQIHMEFTKWENAQRKVEDSPISQAINGVKVSQKICQNCQHTNFSFHYFNDLSLDLGENSNYGPPQGVQDLIKKGFKSHEIEDYKCSNCNKKTNLQKQSFIWKYPQLLFIFVKRFAWGWTAQKKEGAVTLNGQTGLSLSNFCLNQRGKS